MYSKICDEIAIKFGTVCTPICAKLGPEYWGKKCTEKQVCRFCYRFSFSHSCVLPYAYFIMQNRYKSVNLYEFYENTKKL